MGLLDRLRGDYRSPGGDAPASLGRDAARMRATLTGLHAERGGAGEPDLRGVTQDLLEGEVEAPTGDVRWLVDEDVDADEFYAQEVAPNWDGLGENARADKLDGFLELAKMMEASPDALPREMAARLRTKLLLLAWAFDETHGYLGQMAADG
ncbi:MAG TPA: hypothetical protein VJT75_10050 [Thermoleophilaceae bacterium]|nr:hypothetical protein [Thermoleophilaceae bacterium]